MSVNQSNHLNKENGEEKTEEVKMGLGVENNLLLKLLTESLTGNKEKTDAAKINADMVSPRECEVNWDKLLGIAKRHRVLSLLYNTP